MIFKINAEQRETIRKSDLGNMRKNGFIPAIVYGPGTEPLKVTLNKAEFMKNYKKSFGELAFYEIEYAGKNYHTMIKERQIHPVSREILHVDFMVIPPHHLIEVDAPLKFVGTPEGVKEGGLLDIVHRTIKISCREEDIPEDIKVDITHLKLGEALHVRQLPAGNWYVKAHADDAVAVVHTRRGEAATVAAAEKPDTKSE
jgi:large subunit ribosomal protein L25